LLSSWISLVLFLPLYGFLCSAGELVQNVFGKDPTAEFDGFVYQLEQHVFAFRADGCYVLQVDHKFAVLKIASAFSHAVVSSVTQGARSFALQNQTALTTALDNGNIRHSACVLI
jgi:hypothetical protein